MMNQSEIDYQRIEQAIHFILVNFKDQPSLEEVARSVHLSPFHFQRMFKNWVGVSPKKYMQYLSIDYAKKLLKNEGPILETALSTGLSGTSRLHDLFINIEGMTPGEFKNGGQNLTINYSFSMTPFGRVIVASTSKGICHLFFDQNDESAASNLISKFPKASFTRARDSLQENALAIFDQDWTQLQQIKLHLAGTPFQLKVWESLLTLPSGNLASYKSMAKKVGNPDSSRAVGSAVGSNPIAYLIPCHRVIKSTGELGQYMWGSTKKAAIVAWEGVRNHREELNEQG